jgi:DnaJ family protein C protein 28
MSAVERGVDAIIQKAMREGAFDNLAGKGKPLDLRENPFVEREWQLAFRILEQQGFALPWMDKRKDIESGLQAARQSLSRTWNWSRQALEAGEPEAVVEAEWRRTVDRFNETVEKLNKLIGDYNLEVPADVFFREKIDFSKELTSVKTDKASSEKAGSTSLS